MTVAVAASSMLQLLPSGGPLFVLQWSGRLCPCLEKEEDRNARQALQSLRCHATRILWKTGSGVGSSSAASGSASGAGFLSSLFQGAVGGGGGSSANSAAAPARFVVQDDENGEPEFFVDPINEDAATADDSDSQAAPSSFRDSGGGSTHDRSRSSSSVGYKLHVLVRRVDRVTLEGNDVVLLAKKLDPQQPAKQLLRFELLVASSAASTASATPATTEQRNLAVHHLSVLVEWERQRRIGMGYHDGNGNYREEEEDDQPNFLAARAQKAAHFARRELELQQTRRDREKRKAKLVQETGGLKYTALAMANRGESA
jgi:hypothetical protein